jgi:hypothetical protein
VLEDDWSHWFSNVHATQHHEKDEEVAGLNEEMNKEFNKKKQILNKWNQATNLLWAPGIKCAYFLSWTANASWRDFSCSKNNHT